VVDLRKISKSDAARRQIIRLKCTKFDIRWGSAPDPVRELTRLPRPSSCIQGRLFLRGGRGNGRGGKGKKKGNVKGKGKEGTGPILSVFPALTVHPELQSVHTGFPVAFIFKHKLSLINK